ncbi:MAG: Hsp20/alpha crystallin family protein [Clostridiales bacterium]|nr:Hsp20/alpha crystallin family protein [Clostridiales bacterium]
MFNLTPYERKTGLWNPFRELDEIEKSFFGTPAVSFNTDITDEGDSYLLEADLPGFKKDDVNIDIDDGYLTIKAERRSNFEDKDKKGNYVRCERSYGSYSRSFSLDGIDSENITAELKDGVLKLTLPKEKVVTPKTRRLEIK